jgi:hypothetical protein
MAELKNHSAGQCSAGAKPDSGAQLHWRHFEDGAVACGQAQAMRVPGDVGDESIIEMQGLEGALQLRALAVCSARLHLAGDASVCFCSLSPIHASDDQLCEAHSQIVLIMNTFFVRA